MHLTIKADALTYEDLQAELQRQATKFFGDRRFSFHRVDVTIEGHRYAAEANAFEIVERPTRSDVPPEKWDPFRAVSEYAF